MNLLALKKNGKERVKSICPDGVGVLVSNRLLEELRCRYGWLISFQFCLQVIIDL